MSAPARPWAGCVAVPCTNDSTRGASLAQSLTFAPWPPACAPSATRQLLASRGSAREAFERARGGRAHNALGLEIFAPLADAANAWRDARAPAEAERNVHFIGGRCDGPALLALRPPGLRVVCIQFPDPWVLKHARRRVVNAGLADALAELLPVGGEVRASWLSVGARARPISSSLDLAAGLDASQPE